MTSMLPAELALVPRRPSSSRGDVSLQWVSVLVVTVRGS